MSTSVSDQTPGSGRPKLPGQGHGGADAPAVEPSTVGEEVVDGHGHPSDRFYIVVALILAVLTAMEVAASYIDLGGAFLPILFVLMAIKFFMVVSFFMHLRFDNKIFRNLFYSGFVLAIVVYVAALATFQVFG